MNYRPYPQDALAPSFEPPRRATLSPGGITPEDEVAWLRSEVERLSFELSMTRSSLETARAELARLRAARGPEALPAAASEVVPLSTPGRGPTPASAARSWPAAQALAPEPPPSAPLFDAPARAPFEPPPLPRASVAQADQGIDFGAIARLSEEQLNGLPFGLVTLDAEGRVIHYNDTESRLAGLPRARVVGRDFFREIAPCTRVREFEGRFRELVRDPVRVRVQTFDFVFRFARGHQHVTIVMTPARVRGQFHVAMLRRSIDPPAP